MKPLVYAIIGAMCATSACSHMGPAQKAEGMHEMLNAMTFVIDPLYEASVMACDRVEQSIVARPPTTYAKDKQSIEQVRLACNQAFNAFDEIRLVQLRARSVIDSVRQNLGASIGDAERIVADLAGAAEQGKAQWERAKSVLNTIMPNDKNDNVEKDRE